MEKMKIVPITKDGDPILRAQAKDVEIEDIKSKKIAQALRDMSHALSLERYGVAIAAPQIGIPLRIFVVSGKALSKRYSAEQGTEPDKVFINPTILKTSRRKQESHESCLSIQGRPAERGPDVAGIVERPDKVRISYYDEQGLKHEYGASGFLAAIFDHEIDHLNGILFIDKTIEQWEIDKDFNKV